MGSGGISEREDEDEESRFRATRSVPALDLFAEGKRETAAMSVSRLKGSRGPAADEVI